MANHKPSLLAPAGSMESLLAAVRNGADAVYLGGSAFNARRFAGNFDDDELRRAIEYCHARGVAVHITFNTLLFDKELARALEYGAFLHDIGADAAIVQDLGLVKLLRENLPALPLHASTQMGICDTEGAKIAAQMGCAQVVLARETPLLAVREICAESGVDIEVFAHGAMCMGYSGACLLSSMAGERSGNRGTCAQPCRKRISASGMPGADDYALSLSDLCMLSHVKELADAGVACLKLEGRMKRAEYVAAATRAYRAALDGADKKELARLQADLFAVFNRGGERTGYYYGDDGVTNCVAASTADDALLKALRATYANDVRKLPIKMQATLLPDVPAALTISAAGHTVSAEGALVQRAERAQEVSRYAAQLKKLGDTAFSCESLALDMTEDAFLPMGKLNELRRIACARLTEALTAGRTPVDALAMPTIGRIAAREAGSPCILAAQVRTAEQALAAHEAGAGEIWLDLIDYRDDTLLCALQPLREDGTQLLLALPAVVLSREEHGRIERLLHAGLLDGAVANNIGQAGMISHLPIKVAGQGLNALNALAVTRLYELGFDRVMLSQELTKPQMRDILSQTGGGAMIYGRTQNMQLRHCPVREASGCKSCFGSPGALTDEAGRVFPLSNVRQADGCLVRLLNCAATDIVDLHTALPPLDAALLAFYDESPALIRERIASAVRVQGGGSAEALPNTTRGHWSRPVD